MLTIQNFPKINNSVIKNGWWISICRCHSEYYSFKLIQKDAANRVCDSLSVLLSRIPKDNHQLGRMVHYFVVNKRITDIAVTVDWIRDMDNMRRALAMIVDERHKFGY